jgi:hypothetical protein
MNDVQAQDSSASVVESALTESALTESALTEVHTDSDIALKVKVSLASRDSLPGPVGGPAADGADVPRENAVVQVYASAAEEPPAEIPAGCNVALRVTVSCASKCDLRGAVVRIAGEDGPLAERIEVVSFDGAVNRTNPYIVKAPTEIGEHTWTAIIATHEKAGILHLEGSAPFSFRVKPHSTSMAVWDVPSPCTIGARFGVKVGVQCSGQCNLAGREVAIYDQSGAKAAASTLGDQSWSNTGALYWAELEAEAPETEGCFEWEARFPQPDLELPHEGTTYSFSIRTAGRPEHTVTVEVLDRDSNAPVPHADVILPPFRCETDENGMARLMVPTGDYRLFVSAKKRIVHETALKVSSSISITAALLPSPYVDEDS